ncbi:hypothetical protein [Acidithiobacillus thiooxidans]|uniref:hypothetical protein n=1 Tax=Acidithiobacillus thiooxidans TaxID=930 RepID=UPI001B311090|nr:hypothetical protein [Acidithiobacillus thiooxidans]MDX5935681.1 hypothetical protein [Acidithiobacillus thiooxidans]
MSDRDSKLARAIRRHHRYRLQRNRRYYWDKDGLTDNPRWFGKVIDTPTPCSCWMCGNPRRYFGEKTLQELRQDEADGLRRIKKPYFSGS